MQTKMNNRHPLDVRAPRWGEATFPHLLQIFMKQHIGMTSQICGLKKLFSIVAGYRSQMWDIHLQHKAIKYREQISRVSCFFLETFIYVCTSLCFPRTAYCFFLISSCKMLSLCCLWRGKHKHRNIPRKNKCRQDQIRHTVNTHSSSIYNPSCVNQMITTYHENLEFRANCWVRFLLAQVPHARHAYLHDCNAVLCVKGNSRSLKHQQLSC